MDGQGNINLNAPKNITFTAGENFTLNVGQNMTTNIGNNLTNNILGNEITKIEGGVKQDILGDFLFSATNVQQEIKGDKSEDILGKLVQSTAETYAQATQGDMIFQSNNISKFLGKTDVKVNKTSGEMMAVPKVSQIKNKENVNQTKTLLIKKLKVENDKKEAQPNEKLTFCVTEYSIPKEKVTESDKKRIQWAIKIDDQQEVLPEKSEKLELTIKEEWAGKEILVMPFLVKPTEEVSERVKVGFCRYVDVKIITQYICQEIKTNFNHKDTLFMAYLNNLSLQKNIETNISDKLLAYKKWKELVGKDKIWDHKKQIREMQKNRNWSCSKFDKYTIKFNFDIWSNIHYGFIGKRAGFSEYELVNGAGYAQIGDNGKKLSEWKVWEEYFKNRIVDFGDGDILGGFDDPRDTQAIKIGFRLYDKFKNSIHLLTEEAIMEEILQTYKSKKPLSIERCEYHSYY